MERLLTLPAGTIAGVGRDGVRYADIPYYGRSTTGASGGAFAFATYDATELQPRVTLTKKWTSDFMIYASVVCGGGANGPGAPNPILSQRQRLDL